LKSANLSRSYSKNNTIAQPFRHDLYKTPCLAMIECIKWLKM